MIVQTAVFHSRKVDASPELYNSTGIGTGKKGSPAADLTMLRKKNNKNNLLEQLHKTDYR